MLFSRRIPVLVALCCVLMLSACGFHMRGKADLTFESVYLHGSGAILPEIKRAMRSNGIKLTQTRDQADLEVELINEVLEKRILSLSGGGRVKEYELLYRVGFRSREAGAETWSAVKTVEGRRDYSYDDALALAKEGEEQRLNSDMRADATREIMRLLSVIQVNKQHPAASE